MEPLLIEIPHELFAPAESSRFEGEYAMPVLKTGPDLYTFEKPLSWSADITNTGEALLVMGTVEGDAQTSCCRCLEPVNIPFMGEIEGYFLIDPDGVAPEDMDEDEFDVLPDNRKIDFAALIKAALLLEAPLVPLCDDECKGICLTCGANLNQGECSCKQDGEVVDDASANNPFAALKGLKFD